MKKEKLVQLGLTETEAAVYLALLSFGTAKPTQISKKTEIHRVTVFDALERLVQKGLASKYKKGNLSFFTALSPARLSAYLDHEKEEKLRDIEKQQDVVRDILPELLSLQQTFLTKPKIQIFEGEKGMREAYEDTLTAKDGIMAYANVEAMHEGLPKFFPDYYKRRTSKRIFIRVVLTKNTASLDRAKKDREELRESRFLQNENSVFTPEVNIYNNKILSVSWREKLAIVIESKELAQLQKIIFDCVWQTLPRN